MDRFVARVTAGDYDPYRGGIHASDAILELQQKLRAAASPDARRQLVVAYVADAGPKAIDQITAVGGGSVDRQVLLEGDSFLTGTEGAAKSEADLVLFEARSREATGRYDLAQEVQLALAYQIRRRAAIQNPSNYPDLPAQVRKSEVARSQQAINRLTKILHTLQAGMKTGPSKREEEEKASLVEEQRCVAPGPEAREQEAAQQVVAHMKMQRDLAGKRARLAEYHRRMHNGAWSTFAARDQLGGDGIFGSSLGRQAEHGAYAQAEGDIATGRKAMETAEGLFSEADLSSLGATRVTERANLTSGEFVRARNHFDAAIRTYEAIKARHRDQPGLFEGYVRESAPE